MVYLRTVINGSNLVTVSESDSSVVLRGVISVIYFHSTFSQIEFSTHINEGVELIILGDKLTTISYGNEKKDVIGDIEGFIICKGDWCEDYKLTLGIYYSNSGKREDVLKGNGGERSPIWSDYYIGKLG